MPRIQTIHTPAEMRNLAINGALDFWQEKVGTTTTVNTATTHSGYAADMFRVFSEGPTTKNFSYVRSSDVPTSLESGLKAPWSHLFTQITGIASPAAADRITPFQYHMEGSDLVQIFGKTVVFGFWIKVSVAGTYSFAIRNGASDRSYVTTFSVNSANTWEFKSIRVQMDTQGTWTFDNNFACSVSIGTCTGTTFQTSMLNAWQAGNFLNASTSTNWIGTGGATVRVALFSIVEGSLGFGATGFQRASETIQQELAMCQRYYEKSYNLETVPGSLTTVGANSLIRGVGQTGSSFMFQIRKRATPTFIVWNPVTGNSGEIRDAGAPANRATTGGTASEIGIIELGSAATGAGSGQIYQWAADARL